MRVRFDSSRLPVAPPSRGDRGAREVPPRQTNLSPAEIRRALAAAHQSLRGEAIPPKLLDVLSAQVCHETAHGASMFNFNFGGIKGTSPEGTTARLRTREVLQGKEVSLTDGFRAYSTPVAGATDYLLLLERRFPNAVDAARDGDVDGFVRSLKAGHYFTADPDLYASSVRGILQGGFERESPRDDRARPAPDSYLALRDLATGATSNYPTTAAVARVLDAVAAASVDLATPLGEES
jgi:hypothetical protein